MRNFINLLLMWLLVGSVASVVGQQDNDKQEQQTPSQGQASSTAAVKSVTGCVVQSDKGFALKTESESYPIETDRDLSQYVNKEVKVTGILEHHTGTAPSPSSGNGAVISDIRLR